MFPASFLAPALSAFGSMAMEHARHQFITHAPNAIDSVFMTARNSLQNALSKYKKSKRPLARANKPSRTMKMPQRRMRKRIG